MFKRSQYVTIETIEPIGLGLFTNTILHCNEVVAVFYGQLVTEETYSLRCDDGRGGYGIKVRAGIVLDCYEHAKAFKCLASYANCPRNVFRLNSVAKPRANCEIRLHPKIIDRVTLRVKDKIIEKGSELLWNYGSSFRF